MKVVVVGATGAIGRPLVRALTEAGHEVVATARRQPATIPKGVTFRPLNLLDATATTALISDARPDAIIHEATALTGLGNNLRRFDQVFEATNRLRTDGTKTLIAAGRTLESKPRLVAQSFCGWTWAPTGGPIKSEDDPLDPHPAPSFRRTFAAIREQEQLIQDYPGGVALRYGTLYGPGTSMADDGAQIEAVRRRAFPKVGHANAVWSFLHVQDAADATVLALENGEGVYNIVDDHPVQIGEWLDTIAELTGSPTPRRIPTWLARIIGGSGLVHMMTKARGSHNTRARTELKWEPHHPDWRTGFASELRPAAAPSPGGQERVGGFQ